jgi:epoxyqueuosine reductase
MSSRKAEERLQTKPAQFIEDEIRAFVRTSSLNRIPIMDNPVIYDEPLVGFADGDDPIFTEYKNIIAPNHLTPREALAKTHHKSPADMPENISVISWILPVTRLIRESNHRNTVNPSRIWASVVYYGEYKFGEAMQEHLVDFLTEMGYLAAAPTIEPYFKDTMMEQKINGEEWDIVKIKEKGISNWSEKHVAYAAGLGTLSFSGNFISERGVAITIGSVVTSLVLPASQRTADNPYSNCLFYANGTCKACAARCPIGTITDGGHDDINCANHMFDISYLAKKYNLERIGCGMCMTKVPCEFCNPVKKLNKKRE